MTGTVYCQNCGRLIQREEYKTRGQFYYSIKSKRCLNCKQQQSKHKLWKYPFTIKIVFKGPRSLKDINATIFRLLWDKTKNKKEIARILNVSRRKLTKWMPRGVYGRNENQD